MTVKRFGNENVVVKSQADGGRKSLRSLSYAVGAAALIVSLAAACQKPLPFSAAESNGPFDAPINKVTVDLGASPYYPDGQDGPPTALSCFYFPEFIVKQSYLGGRGAEWLSILRNPEETPECKSSHEPGERIIEYPEWEGYFMGVKGDLVFFKGSDTVNGGLPFAVYDALNGEKIFEDSVYYERASFSSYVEAIATDAGYLLRYLRVADTDCDLNSEGIACWNAITAEHALVSDDMPLCTGYERIAELVGTDHVESVIAYAVEVTLSPLPSIQSLAGTTRCWASH